MNVESDKKLPLVILKPEELVKVKFCKMCSKENQVALHGLLGPCGLQRLWDMRSTKLLPTDIP